MHLPLSPLSSYATFKEKGFRTPRLSLFPSFSHSYIPNNLSPPSSLFQQPGIILLREGTDTSQGRGQLITNINACAVVVDAVRTTLGPRGMDKLMIDSNTGCVVAWPWRWRTRGIAALFL